MTHDRTCPSAEQLEAAIAGLRPLERQVLILATRKRLPNAVIARRLGITTGRAARVLARALRKLDRALERRRDI